MVTHIFTAEEETEIMDVADGIEGIGMIIMEAIGAVTEGPLHPTTDAVDAMIDQHLGLTHLVSTFKLFRSCT